MKNFSYIKKITLIIMVASLIFCLGLGIGIFFAEHEEIEKQTKKLEKISQFGSFSINNKTEYSKTLPKVIAPDEKDYNKKTNAEPLRQNHNYSLKKKNHLPKWIDNSIPVFKQPEFSYIAIVLDDMGLNKNIANEVFELGGPLTLSYLSYAPNLIEQTTIASSKGHELMLHLPMEPLGDQDPGPGALLVDMKNMELNQRLNLALEKFPNFIGINNHMGSRFTSNSKLMEFLISSLKKRGYLFLDSVTTSGSVALKMGRRLSAPVVARDIFLDDVDSEKEVKLRLAQTELIAKKTGTAIAIGHPRKATLRVLKDWMHDLQQKKIQLVPLSAIAQIRLDKIN
ncbi:MAG: hypothetical protein CMM43_01025 [Rhodospirillaceae bacterium]|nr:hypothetical protein [Rhodospirillaceae bacterium]